MTTETGPYIPTDEELGEFWRQELGIDGTAGDAQDVDHPFRGSHIRGVCFVCGLAQSYRRHGTIHVVDDGKLACDPDWESGLHPLMSERTRNPEFANCPGCVAATR
jgi:hypothetical protein